MLIVEDEAGVRSLLVMALRRRGFFVHEADGAEQAMEVIAAHGPPDVLVTDVVMRSLSGPELVKELRVTYPTLPVLYMSGYARDKLDEALNSFLGCVVPAEAVHHRHVDHRSARDPTAGLTPGICSSQPVSTQASINLSSWALLVPRHEAEAQAGLTERHGRPAHDRAEDALVPQPLGEGEPQQLVADEQGHRRQVVVAEHREARLAQPGLEVPRLL